MEPPTGTPVPSHLAGVISELVDRAVTELDDAQVVDDLVATSRWNPALLMMAAEQAGRLADACPEGSYKPAVENLEAAEGRVRQRAY